MIRALFGGTFDPIHNGHLKTAQSLVDELAIDALHLMPNSVPPHRPQPEASGEQRLKMVQLACQAQANLIAEPFELRSPPPSYTIKTLQQFHHQYPDSTLLFVMGMDSLVSLDSWYQWQQLLNYSHLLVLPRPGYQLTDASSALLDYIRQHQTDAPASLADQRAGFIYLANTPQIDISATEIRQQLAHGDTNIDVPKAVQDYIIEQQIYTPQG